MPRAVLGTELGRATLVKLAQRHETFRLLGADTSFPQHRHVRDRERSLVDNAVTDLLALTEAFFVARLLCADPSIKEEKLRTWQGRLAACQTKISLPLASHGQWRPLMGYVEARNALQHGQGRLTNRQLVEHRKDVLLALAAADVHLNGDLVVLVAEDVTSCHRACASIVRYLDEQAPA